MLVRWPALRQPLRKSAMAPSGGSLASSATIGAEPISNAMKTAHPWQGVLCWDQLKWGAALEVTKVRERCPRASQGMQVESQARQLETGGVGAFKRVKG